MSDKNKNVASTGNTVGKVTSAGGPGFGNKREEGLSGKVLLKVDGLKVSYGGIRQECHTARHRRTGEGRGRDDHL